MFYMGQISTPIVDQNSLLIHTMESIMKIKKINPLEVVQEQYQNLKGKLLSTNDVREKDFLFKRLNNLANVMQFLISISKNT
jgi:hypothetical protein